jgi:hypothetical protein
MDLDLPQPLIEKMVCNNDVSTPILATLTLAISTVLVGDKPLLLSPTATRLRNITVLVSQMIPPYLRFPWAQLTEFRSNSISHMEDCFDIFRLCPNLTHLSLRNIQEPVDGSHRRLVTLPKLFWLELASFDPLGSLLDNLIVPNLREVCLEANSNLSWPKSQFIALVSRSLSTLGKLTINQNGIVGEEISECFERIHTLQEISVIERWNPKVYRRRAGSEGGSALYEEISA